MLFFKKAASLIFALLLILTLLTSCGLFDDTESKPEKDPDINCGLIINEICSSNETLLADSYGAYSDWIELYNSSSSDINLLGFSLTDDLSDKTKYSFGDATIKKGEYMIVFASGMDIHSGSELHTSFKISASGENIALYTPAGNRISLMEVPAMEADKT
ncbi:MAG TPA: lamin tail domain-containing protein, partial [Bacillota bacterium]|nr:lamin tail domain-containing protein [Bacillota bacterium]